MSHVGIFWFVPANLGGWSALVADVVPIKEVPAHAGLKRYPRSHADVWTGMARLGERRLRASGYPRMIARADYQVYPRGRVDFEVGGRRFIVRLDRVLQRADFIAQVVARFEALPGHLTVIGEPAYTSSRPIGPPKPWE